MSAHTIDIIAAPGVTFVLVKNNGLDAKTYSAGLKEWQRRHPAQVEDAEEAGRTDHAA